MLVVSKVPLPNYRADLDDRHGSSQRQVHCLRFQIFHLKGSVWNVISLGWRLSYWFYFAKISWFFSSLCTYDFSVLLACGYS